MARLPQISGIIARQVGSIQGKVSAQVQDRVLEILSKFTSQCPTGRELQNIIKQRANLLKVLNSFEKRITPLKATADKLRTAITAARVLTRLLKATPLPTTLGTPPGPAGGVIFSLSVGKVITVGDRLATINKILDSLEADKVGILGVVDSVSSTLTSLKNRLNAIDLAIQECSKESPDLPEILATTQPKENTGSEGTPDANYEYKGYKLEIIQDPNSPQIAPRRYAVARDRRGIVVLKGQPSFSSSVDVLLDEIKFRIDNQRFS
jgi:hypothetical protein